MADLYYDVGTDKIEQLLQELKVEKRSRSTLERVTNITSSRFSKTIGLAQELGLIKEVGSWSDEYKITPRGKQALGSNSEKAYAEALLENQIYSSIYERMSKRASEGYRTYDKTDLRAILNKVSDSDLSQTVMESAARTVMDLFDSAGWGNYNKKNGRFTASKNEFESSESQTSSETQKSEDWEEVSKNASELMKEDEIIWKINSENLSVRDYKKIRNLLKEKL